MTPNDNHTDIYDLGDKYGYLPYMIERYVEMLGTESTRRLLLFNEKKLPKTIRLNSLRAPFSTISRRLNEKGIKLKKINEHLPEGREVLESPFPLGATPEYLNGYYMLQGKNSLYPAILLNPRSNELVGDFTAAPGGKTSHLAQIMNNKGTIVAIEISSKRCRSLKANLSRMGVMNTIVLNMDARGVKELNLEFDKILLDVPCSGSGIIITDPTRKSSKTLTDLANFNRYQIEILSKALEVLKSGGELVYCTCSLEIEENEIVISKALEIANLDLKTIEICGDSGLTKFKDYKINSKLSKAKRLYPHKTNGEGFFIVKMVKK